MPRAAQHRDAHANESQLEVAGWLRLQVTFAAALLDSPLSAQFFLIATACVAVTVWFAHRDGYVKLSPGDLRAANWYLLCGAYIHFLMDGLVGCYGVWGLMRRAYETLDGRFPHAPSPDAGFVSGSLPEKTIESNLPFSTPSMAMRRSIPNFSVPFVVGHLEMIVYFPLCLALYYAYKRGLAWRRPLEILVASFQLFGAIIFMGSEEVMGSPNLFIKGHVTGAGLVKQANLIDSICFYWFAYLFANLIWVFVPIPLIWKATADICNGEIKTCLPWVNPDGSVEDEFLVESLAEGEEGDEVDEDEEPFFDDDEEEVEEQEHKKTR